MNPGSTVPLSSVERIREWCGSDVGGVVVRGMNTIIDIVDWLEEEDLLGEVFLSLGFYGFVVSDRPEIIWGRNMLLLNARYSEDLVMFEYHRIEGSADVDHQLCRREEAVEKFRQFLTYKFGIHRPERKESNQSVQTRPTSRPV